MKKLWAPWRIEYIKNLQEEGCFFCRYITENNDSKHLIVYRGKKAFVIMNYYPYNNGHVMIAPYRHTSKLDELDTETRLEIMQLVNIATKALKAKLNAAGFNIGLNLGNVAGAGIDDHLHVHVVPRWSGDTNFMPVLGHTKVVSQALEDSRDCLHRYFKKYIEN